MNKVLNDAAKNSEKEASANQVWMEKIIALLKSISEEDAQKVKDHFVDYLEGKISLAELEDIQPQVLNEAAQLGYSNLKNARYDEAQKIFEVLCFLDHKNVLYQTALASCFHKAAKLDDALVAYTLALELDPQETAARVNRAEILFSLGYYNESVGELDYALKHAKPDRESWLARAKALKNNIIAERDKLGIPAEESKLFTFKSE